MPSTTLTPTERAVLDLEGRHYKYQGAREGDIREHLGMTPTRFYQVLNQLIDTEAALAYNPLLVNRLRERRWHRGARRRQVA